MPNEAGFLTVEEAMSYIGIDCAKRSFMVYYVHGKTPKIQSMLIGRNRYFDKSDLDDFMKSQKTKTRHQVLNSATS